MFHITISLRDERVAKISENFRNGRGSEFVVAKDGVKETHADGFEPNEDLMYPIIPSTVREIAPSTFYMCSSLEAITIPSSITQIDPDAFPDDCRIIRRFN